MASRLFYRNSIVGSATGIPAPPGTPGQDAILIKHCYFHYCSTTTTTTVASIVDAVDGAVYFQGENVAAAATSTPVDFEVHDLLCIHPTTGLPAQGVNIFNSFANATGRGMHVVFQYVSSNHNG